MTEFIPSCEDGPEVPPIKCSDASVAADGLLFVFSGALGLLERAENIRSRVTSFESRHLDPNTPIPLILGPMGVAPGYTYESAFNQVNLWRANRLESRAMKLMHHDT